jgi:hypothetical protein
MPIYALQYPTYAPAIRLITAITIAEQAQVTTSFDHGYVDNTVVRFYIPLGWGMYQINQEVGTIIVTGATTFLVTIDTRMYEPFVVPVIQTEVAQVVPIGSQGGVPLTYNPALNNILT